MSNHLIGTAQNLEGGILHSVDPRTTALLCKGCTITQLPSAKECYGRHLTIKMMSAGVAVLLGVSGELVLDSASFFLQGQYISTEIVSDGNNWVAPEEFMEIDERLTKIGACMRRWKPPEED